MASFVLTLTQLFLLASFGMMNYGNRSIGYYKGLSFSKRVTFSNLALLQAATSLISLVVYLAVILAFFPGQFALFIISAITIVASGIDYSWYFVGSDQIKSVALRNILVKAFSFLLIVLFLKDSSQINLYLLLTTASYLGANLLMLYYLPRSYRKIFYVKYIFNKHVKSALLIFIPQFLVLIYGSIDKVLLGTLSNKYSLGLFDSSQRIVLLLATLTVSLTPIMISKLSELSRGENKESIAYYAKKSLEFVMYVSFPIAFGLAAIAPKFIPFYFGEKFIGAVPVMILLAPVVGLAGILDVFLHQIYISLKRDRYYLFSVCLMVVLSVILNLILIPQLQHNGAAIASSTTYFLVVITKFYLVRDVIKIAEVYKSILRTLFAAAFMYAIIYFFEISESYPIAIVAKVIVGFASYIILAKVVNIEMQQILINKLMLQYRSKFRNP